MIYQKPQISKIMVILLMTALSLASSCADYTFNHSGLICSIDDDESGLVADVCAAHPSDFMTLFYCTQAECTDCLSVTACLGFYPTLSYKALTHTMLSTGAIFIESPVTCKILEDEYCYRSSTNTDKDNEFVLGYEDNGTVEDNTPECCLVECDEKFIVRGQVCGFYDNAFTKLYSSESEFCTDYCKNRQLTFINCGSPGCGEDQLCLNTEESCAATFDAQPPVCGSDFKVYSSVDSYCKAKVAGTVTNYYINGCINGCKEVDCEKIRCNVEELDGYSGVTVCGDNGVFFFSTDSFCTARYAEGSLVTGLIECGEGSPCTTEKDCCVAHCLIINEEFVATCGSNTNYYDDINLFCNDSCDVFGAITLLFNEGAVYTRNECSSLKCQAKDFKTDVCTKIDYSVVTNKQYCDDLYVSGAPTYKLVDFIYCSAANGNLEDCDITDCAYEECLADIGVITENICAKDSKGIYFSYETAASFCLAQGVDATLDNFNCTKECDTDKECCVADCVPQFISYTITCRTDFELYADSKEYCTGKCNGESVAQCGPADSKTNCNQQECWYNKCLNSPYFVGCDDKYETVDKESFCDQKSKNNNTNPELNYCGSSDCKNCKTFKCDDQTAGLNDSGLCLEVFTVGDGYYDNPEAYCTAAIVTPLDNFDTTGNVICNDAGCTPEECCKKRCEKITVGYLNSCDKTTYEFVTLDKYCIDNCKITPVYDLDDCEIGCKEDDCKVLECTDTIELPQGQTSICLAGETFDNYYFETEKDYCQYLVDGGKDYLLSSENGCVSGDCSDDAKCCKVRCLANDYKDSCNADNFDFINEEAFCNYRCNSKQDYVLLQCFDPAEPSSQISCLPSDCLKKKCINSLDGIVPKGVICLPANDFRGELFTDKEDFCSKRSLANSSNFDISKDIDCKTANCPNKECCEANCAKTNGYLETCDPTDYSLVNLEKYCSSWCADSKYTPIKCGPSGCTSPKCEKIECLSKLQATFTGGVCLKNKNLGQYHFLNVSAYCDAIISIADNPYAVPETSLCKDGKLCVSERECYIANCTGDLTYLNKCDPTTFEVLDEEEACGYKFDNKKDNYSDLNTCTDGADGAGSPINCIDCKYFKCLDENKSYSVLPNSVCLDEAFEFGNPKESKYYFDSLSKYCKAIVLTSAETYTLESAAYIVCDTKGCDETKCCKARCLSEPLSGCKPSDFVYKTADDYCNDYCKKDIYTPITCQGGCDDTKCSSLLCQDDLKSITGSVCLSQAIDDDDEKLYFQNIKLYCDEVADPAISEYSLENYDCTSGPCDGKVSCCQRNCITGTFDNLCEIGQFSTVDEARYCLDECGSSSLDLRPCYDPKDDKTVIPCGDCLQVQCEVQTKNLVGDEVLTGYCGTDNVFYTTIRGYCRKEISDSITIQMCPGPNSTEIMCNSTESCCDANCRRLNSDFKPVCSATFEFLDTLDKYCEKYCPSGVLSLYSNNPDAVALKRDCAIQKCINEDTTFKDVCSADTYELITEEKNCAALYDATTINTRSCGVVSCTIKECNLQKCEFKDLENYPSATVCDTNNNFYDSKEEFCKDKDTDSKLETIVCTSQPCTFKNCCEANCIGSFDGTVERFCDVLFAYYNTAAEFCTASCNVSGQQTLSVKECGDTRCNQNECCSSQCQLLAKDVCDPTDAISPTVPVPAIDFCDNKCELGTSYTDKIKSCTGDCKNEDCQVFKCAYDVEQDYGVGAVCASDRVLYDDAIKYCEAKYNSESPTDFSYTKCKDGSVDKICSDDSLCCQKACADEYESSFDAVCTSDYEWLETAAGLCTFLCLDDDNGEYVCPNSEGGGTHACNKNECCLKKCNSNANYVGVCSADFKHLSQSSYCSSYCEEPKPTFNECDGGCADSTDCEKLKCKDVLKNDYANKKICLGDLVKENYFYESLDEYCDAVAKVDLEYTDDNFLSCEGGDCDSESCCKAHCNNKDNYLQKCHPNNYVPLSQSDFCDYDCATPKNDPVDICLTGTEETGCANCDIFECQDQTNSYSETICLKVSVNYVYFFSNNTAYCNAKITAGDSTFTINSDDLLCKDSTCNEESECCAASCSDDPSVNDACKISDYSVVLKTAYCTAICNGKQEEYLDCGANKCENKDCQVFKCEAENPTFAKTPVCYVNVDATNPTSIVYFNSLNSYCAEKATVPPATYVVTNEQLCESEVSGVSTACTSEVNCCKSYCKSQAYKDSCNALHEVLSEEEYCTNFCNNKGVYPMDTCTDESGQINCQDCKLFKCLEEIDYDDKKAIGVCLSDETDEFVFYPSYKAYCEELIDNGDDYILENNQECSLVTGCTETTCCEYFCNSKTFSGACNPETFAFVDKATYCTDKCGQSPTAYITCDDSGCTEKACNILACKDAYTNYEVNGSVCFAGEPYSIYYGSVDLLCAAKIEAKSTDYQYNDVVYCAGDKSCAGADKCNEAVCLTKETLNRCDPVSYQTVSPASYCERKYVTKDNTVYDECFGPDTMDDADSDPDQISCNSCTYFECLDVNVSYNTTQFICTSDDVSYATIQLFCDAKDIKPSLEIFDCKDGLCNTDLECCKDLCLSKQDPDTYVPQCDNVDFVLDSTINDYCESYCNNRRSYTKFGEKTACCVQKCIVDGGATSTCKIGTYEAVTINESCADFCGEDLNDYKSCGSPSCNQVACNKLKCLDVSVVALTYEKVCGNNGTLYSTKDSFCEAQSKNTSIGFIDCKGGECQDSVKCCEANCIIDKFGLFSGPVCDTDFNSYDDPVEFCTEFCKTTRTEPLVLKTCTVEGKEVPCDRTVCCVGDCKNQYTNKVCYPVSTKKALSPEEFCNAACPDDLDGDIKVCGGDDGTSDCTDAECELFYCEYDIKSKYGNIAVCTDEGIRYTSPENYCSSLSNPENSVSLNLLKCDNSGTPGECADDIACREKACLNRFSVVAFTARCATDYEWFENKESYCDNLSDDADLIDYDTCGATSNQLCSKQECCSELCNNTDYSGKCSSNFTYLTKSEYCNKKCSTTETFVECANNACAGELDCEEEKCASQLSEYSSSGVCIGDDLEETYHYSLVQHCENEAAGDKNYSDDAFVSCNDKICNGSVACCNSICNGIADYKIGCNSKYELINQSTYCSEYKCIGADESNIDRCKNDKNEIISCVDCDEFRCEDDNKSLTGTICLAGEDNAYFHFENIKLYCIYKADKNAGLLDYKIPSSDLKCTGSECGNPDTCCNKVCNDKGDKQDKCAADFTVYSVSKQCSDECNSLNPASSDCNGGCNQDKCDIQKCESLNSAITGTVCTTNSIDSVNFFNNINEYCTEKNDSANHFDVIVSIPCADCDVAKCCSSICQQDQLTTCNAATYQTVDPKTFCDDECLETPLLTVDLCYDDSVPPKQIACVNCYLFECLDAYTATATANGGKICLSPATGDNFHFSDVDLYCEFLIGGNVTNFAPIVNFACTDGVCSSPEECCHDQCVETTNDACKADFTFVSKSEICTAQCAGTPLTGQTDCGGVDCTVAKCLARKCVNDWGVYSGPVCLEDDSSSYNYYASVSEYCTDISDDVGGAYVTTNPAYCTASACDGETNCCEEVCSSDKTNNLCDPDTYDVLTPSQYCEKDCKADTEKISCSNNQGNISCTVDECKRLKCLKVFDDADYIGTELCLSTAYENKYLYTVEEYCQEQSTEPAKVDAVPTNQRCKSDAGIEETCKDDDDCCYAACLVANPYKGCDSSLTVVSPESICADKCGEGLFTIRYCPGADCPSCDTLDCLNENPSFAKKSICLQDSTADPIFYSTIQEYCVANSALGTGKYAVPPTILCGTVDCLDEDKCCEAQCKAKPELLTCDPTKYTLVTEDIRCDAFCPTQTVTTYLGCVDDNGKDINCSDALCNEQHACPSVFTTANFSGSLCLQTIGTYAYYANYQAYCKANTSVVLTEIPTEIDCDTTLDGTNKCAKDRDCCVSVCLLGQTISGCDSGFNLITPQLWCEAKCDGKGELSLDYCTVSGCADCKLLECQDSTKNYLTASVCLTEGIGSDSTVFFDSRKAYCEAMIKANLTDYDLELDEYVLCEGVACTQTNCCEASCNANDYLNTCAGSNYTLFTRADYCNKKCLKENTLTTPCLNVELQPVSCTNELCCASKLIAQTNSTGAVCANNGAFFASPLEFCNAKTLKPSLINIQGILNEISCRLLFCPSYVTTYPICGSNYKPYLNQNDFCNDYSKINTLTSLGNCGAQQCDALYCCELKCTNELKPVLYVVGGTVVGYKNSCFGTCARGVEKSIFTCEVDTTVAGCIATYDADCGGDCATYIASDDDYCTAEDGYLSAAAFCAKYICSESADFGDTYNAIDCKKYDCSKSRCGFSVCLTREKCADGGDKVCGTDGKVYPNICHATCAGTTLASRCPATGDCDNYCIVKKCTDDTKNEPYVPVCAPDTIVYNNAKLATCVDASNSDSFPCAADCNGTLRLRRCQFDCKFNHK